MYLMLAWQEKGNSVCPLPPAECTLRSNGSVGVGILSKQIINPIYWARLRPRLMLQPIRRPITATPVQVRSVLGDPGRASGDLGVLDRAAGISSSVLSSSFPSFGGISSTSSSPSIPVRPPKKSITRVSSNFLEKRSLLTPGCEWIFSGSNVANSSAIVSSDVLFTVSITFST